MIERIAIKVSETIDVFEGTKKLNLYYNCKGCGERYSTQLEFTAYKLHQQELGNFPAHLIVWHRCKDGALGMAELYRIADGGR